MSTWYELKALAGVSKIFLYDNIGKDGVTAKAFREDLEKLRGPIEIHINSRGGVVTEGFSIYNLLKDYPGKKTVYINSLAASMASLIAMAGDTVCMPENGLMMIHNPWVELSGDSKQMRKTAEVLDKMKNSMVEAYHKKTAIAKAEVINIMDNETWLNGREALELGFIDELIGEDSAQKSINARSSGSPTKIFKSQHSKPSNYHGIRK